MRRLIYFLLLASLPSVAKTDLAAKDASLPYELLMQTPEGRAIIQDLINNKNKHDTTVVPTPPPKKDRILDPDAYNFITMPDDIQEEAFGDATNYMSPQDIKDVRAKRAILEKSSNAPLVPVNPVSKVTTVQLAPGSAPPIINTRSGYITSLVFVDEQGSPWPIEWALPGTDAYEAIGKPTDNEKQADPKPHLLTLATRSNYKETNYTIALVGLQEPIVLLLRNSLDGPTDFKRTLRIPKAGPITLARHQSTAEQPLLVGGGRVSAFVSISPDKYDEFLTSAPDDASEIPSNRADLMTAWWYEGKLVVRAKYELAELNYTQVSAASNGWRVYVFAAPPFEISFITNNGLEKAQMPLDIIQNYRLAGGSHG